MERKYESPGERMDKLLIGLKRKRSIRGIRSIVSEILEAKSDDMREFCYKINNHRWRGIVFLKRNSLMGSIFSLFDTKLWCLRGYPKIKYSDDSRVYLKECITQNKYDGTNLGLFHLPDGTLMAKTRMSVSWEKEAFKRRDKTWKDLFLMIDNGQLLSKVDKALTQNDYVIYGELYGSLNPGDFIKYSVDIAFKVFDILDRKTQRFLSPDKVYEICQFYDIPHVEETWKGLLSDKEIERIEFELESQVRENGAEGWVGKTFLSDEKDVYCCKLKCEKIKETCYEKSSKPTIPTGIIRKAVRKVLENFPEAKTIETMEPYVLDELKEEVEETLIQSSIEKIRSNIRWSLTPADEDLLKLVIEEMKQLQMRGINLENKQHILSNLASSLGTISGGTLYRLYNLALKELK